MVNPKNSFEVGSSSQPYDTYHEQVEMVVTLKNGREVETRNGREVETRTKEPRKDASEFIANPKGSGTERISKGKEVTPPSSSTILVVAPPYVPKTPFSHLS